MSKANNKLSIGCEKCRWWRYTRTDNANVCVNPNSDYYGEDTDARSCCIDFETKEGKNRKCH